MKDLMAPRVKCIGNRGFHYPGSPFMAGEILNVEPDGEIYYYEGRNSVNPSYYPHLFQPLQWWQERTAKEMPEYVEIDTYIFKVYVYDVRDGLAYKDDWCIGYNLNSCSPATEEQYLNQIKE